MQSRKLTAARSLSLAVIALTIAFSIQPSDAVELKSGLLIARAEPYTFTENIKVPLGKTWTVEAGAVLCFSPNTELVISGTLEVNGTKDKPVVFSSCVSNATWRGMTFTMSRTSKGRKSLLQYAIVERADKSKLAVQEQPERANGGGIQIEKSDVEITDSVIRFNTAANGGGLYIGSDSTVTVRRCLIHSNRALGSNNIYSGGGGIYIAYPQNASIWRSTIALNSFSRPGYPNEEGGGGLYLATGSASQLGFNLIVGNEAGKGAGLLLGNQALHTEEDTLPLIGNVFAYNRGSRNFEQVAIQTRYSFQPITFLNTWFANIGQFPFVAYLNREQLVRYVDNGDKEVLRQIVPDKQQAARSFGHLVADRMTKENIGANASNVLAESQLCKDKFDLGPLELCDALDRPSLAEYIGRLATRHRDHEFGKSLLRLLQPGPDLSDYAPLFRYVDGNASNKVPEDYLVMAIGSDERRAKTIEQMLRDPVRLPEARGFTVALWAYALGDNHTFQLLVQNPAYAKKVLLNAAANGFVDAALRAYTVAVDPADPDPELIYQTMSASASNGLTRLVERLLDDGFDPDFSVQGSLPLIRAADAGHKEVVQLLLRRGANPNQLLPMSKPHQPHIPLLYASVGWYHLGEGFRDIAEMLIAAGADFGSLRFDKYDPRPLFLTTILQLGYVLPPGILGTPADYMREEENEFEILFAERIKIGEIVQAPIIEKIRKLRGTDTDAILKDLSSHATIEQKDVWQLAAALRILSVRDFDLDEASRRSLVEVYESLHGNELRKLVPPEEVFLRFRRVSAQKEAQQPIAKGDSLLPKNQGHSSMSVQNLPYERKIAVLIGIANYKNLSPIADIAKGSTGPFNLRFAEKDATDFKALLSSGRMGSNWEIVDLVGPSATNEAVDLRLKALQSEIKENDLLLFFFSGHGFADQKERNSAYLFFHDSKLDKLPQTAMSLGTLRKWAMSLKAKHVILLLDACRSGLLSTAKGNSTLTYDAFFEATQFGQSPGKVAITSSLGADQSYEWPERQNGYFTALLISALTERIARPGSGNYLTIKDLYVALGRELPSETRRSPQRLEQMPNLIQLDGGNIIDFPIAIAK